jgi:hypothetical protein
MEIDVSDALHDSAAAAGLTGGLPFRMIMMNLEHATVIQRVCDGQHPSSDPDFIHWLGNVDFNLPENTGTYYL